MSAIADLLVRRQVVLERVVELLLPVRVGAEGVAGDGLARGVELQQLLGHVAHGLLDARLGLLPGRAAELVERRAGAAGVLLDEIEPLERDEQLVVAGVAELHELLRRRCPAPTREALQADEPADAVVDVDDEIADLQVAEVGDERARRRTCGARARAAPPRRDRVSAKSRRRAAGRWKPRESWPVVTSTAARSRSSASAPSARADVVVGEQLDRALGAARRGRDEHDGLAVLARLADLVDPVADAAVILDDGSTEMCVRVRRVASSSIASWLTCRAAASHGSSVAPGSGDRLVRRHVAAARRHVRGARAPLRLERPAALGDVVELEDDHRARRPCARSR